MLVINKEDLKRYILFYFEDKIEKLKLDLNLIDNIHIDNNKINMNIRGKKSKYISSVLSYQIPLKDFLIYLRKDKLKKIL